MPDLAGWRRERLPAMPDEAFFSLAPDWVCEVLSPSTERIDRGRKLRIYAEAGVAHAWLVKPTDRTLEVLRLRDGAWTIVGVWEDAALVRAEPFEAVELELGRLWAESRDRGSAPGLRPHAWASNSRSRCGRTVSQNVRTEAIHARSSATEGATA